MACGAAAAGSTCRGCVHTSETSFSDFTASSAVNAAARLTCCATLLALSLSLSSFHAASPQALHARYFRISNVRHLFSWTQAILAQASFILLHLQQAAHHVFSWCAGDGVQQMFQMVGSRSFVDRGRSQSSALEHRNSHVNLQTMASHSSSQSRGHPLRKRQAFALLEILQ